MISTAIAELLEAANSPTGRFVATTMAMAIAALGLVMATMDD